MKFSTIATLLAIAHAAPMAPAYNTASQANSQDAATEPCPTEDTSREKEDNIIEIINTEVESAAEKVAKEEAPCEDTEAEVEAVDEEAPCEDSEIQPEVEVTESSADDVVDEFSVGDDGFALEDEFPVNEDGFVVEEGSVSEGTYSQAAALSQQSSAAGLGVSLVACVAVLAFLKY
jgi:hypothetical protein